MSRDYNINELINTLLSPTAWALAYLWSRYKNDTKSRMCNKFYGMVYWIYDSRILPTITMYAYGVMLYATSRTLPEHALAKPPHFHYRGQK